MSDGASCACLRVFRRRTFNQRTREHSETWNCDDCGDEFLSRRRANALMTETQRQLADTRAILSDLLAERGESWLAQVATRRAELLEALREAEKVGHDRTCARCDQARGTHSKTCSLGGLLRVIGGDLETQRQVDAEHEAALNSMRQPMTATEAHVRELNRMSRDSWSVFDTRSNPRLK